MQASVRVEAGTVLFREGDLADCAYFVERGQVEVSVWRQGRRVVLNHKVAGELFGEMALIEGGRRSATIVALSPCELIPITREQLLARFERADPVVRLCLTLLMNRLRWTVGEVAATDPPPLVGEPAADRVDAAQAIRLEHELDQALVAGQLELHFQPIVALATGCVAGFEALARWRHPERGLILPGAFLPTAEATGFIRRIDAWAMAEACRAVHRFRALTAGTGREAPYVSVNVSAPSLGETGFLDRVVATVRAADIPPAALTLELTESTLMATDPGGVLAGCRELGVGLALDDFGTGYSALSYLHRFPIDLLKLDRSFVQDAGGATGTPPILGAVLRLARDLGLPLVAEGIERRDQRHLLAALGAGFGQGFHFAHALPPVEAEALLARLWRRPVARARTRAPQVPAMC